MKVLHINTVRTRKNGITNVIFNLLLSSDQKDLKQDLMAINKPDISYIKEVYSAGGELFVLQRNGKHFLKYIFRLRDLIKKEKYDIVHIHGNSHTTVFELVAAKLAGCKVRIVHAHSTSCTHPLVHKLFAPLFSLLCTCCFACGEEAGRFMYGKKKFAIINNAVNVEKFRFDSALRIKYREELGANTDTLIIGHVGFINENKNQMFLVRAFDEYQKSNPNSRLILIGDGPERENVKNEILSLGIKDKVSMLGVREDVQGLLNALDVFALPSHYEGLPLTAIEAQTNGLPCLISANVTPDVDKTGNVKFLPITDTLPWSDSLAEISVMSDGEREAACLAAIEKIRESGYDIKQEAVKLHALYSSLIK